MGYNLRIIPAASIVGIGKSLSKDVITLEQEYDLFELIHDVDALNGREVFRGGIQTPLGDMESDGFCDTLRSIQAGILYSGIKGFDTNNWRNNAFISWLENVPPELEVYLYWY